MSRRRADAEPAAQAPARRPAARRPRGRSSTASGSCPGGSEADAERVLAGLTPASAREREATKELADRQILAHPDRFEDAHHLLVKALEVFDRHGWRAPRLPRWLGPLRPLAVVGVEQVTRVIVRSYARTISNSLRRLYARREAQCDFDQPERRPLARARIAMTRLAPDFGGGGRRSAALPRRRCRALGAGLRRASGERALERRGGGLVRARLRRRRSSSRPSPGSSCRAPPWPTGARG